MNFNYLNQANDLLHVAFCFKRLASLLIVTQLVNQVTEVVVPFLVDRLLSAPHRKESKDDPEEDKFRNQSTLPDYPVSLWSQNSVQPLCRPCDDVYLFISKQFYC